MNQQALVTFSLFSTVLQEIGQGSLLYSTVFHCSSREWANQQAFPLFSTVLQERERRIGNFLCFPIILKHAKSCR